MNVPESIIENHNTSQKNYFSKSVKETMIPRDTPYVTRQVDRLIRWAEIREGDRVLDLGCGMGKYTLEMARRGLSIEGLDLSPFLLQKFREYDNGRYNVPLYESDIIRFPAELAGRFDVVVGFFVLHHVHDIEACFGACRDLLRPGGRLVFLEPNPYNPLYYIQIFMTPGMTWQGDGGLVRMRRGLMFRSMKQAGLTDMQLERFGFFPRFVTNWPVIGLKLETVFERMPWWRMALPFQLFKAQRPELP